MKILFFMRNPGYARNFESTLRLLAGRGHRVHLAFETHVGPKKRELVVGPARMVDRLRADEPNVSVGLAPNREGHGWTVLAWKLRVGVDYLRYLEPRYRDADRLRGRVERRVPRWIKLVADPLVDRSPDGLARLARLLRAVERVLPRAPGVDAFVGAHRPDLVLVTPLVELGAPQVDYLRAARACGVRTGLLVASWDNLTNKGLVPDPPDLVTVWNEPMRREAVELHGVPPERVAVTGAQPYDHWFSWRPSTSREAFCARVGLAADRPFLLYTCSSPFIAPADSESRFVVEWAQRLRADRRLCEVGVLVRPHPQNAEQWRAGSLELPPNVAVWPRGGAEPVDEEARANYYDSISHSAAVVGINTSALIESAIVGRPVYTLLAPEFRETQGGTLHFQHLARPDGGLLQVAATLEEHLDQLAEALAADGRDADTSDDAAGRGRRFLEAFVRPHGLDQPATPRVVDAIERLCAEPAPRPLPAPRSAVPIRLALAPLAAFYELRPIHLLKDARGHASHLFRLAGLLGVRTLFRSPPARRLVVRRLLPSLPPTPATKLRAELELATTRTAGSPAPSI